MDRQIEISDINQLNNLLKNKEIESHYIKLIIDELDSYHIEKFEKRLNRYKSTCGCEVGAYFLYSTLLGLITWYIFFSDFNLNLIFALKNIGVLIFMAFWGKIIGILSYKFLFRKTITNINGLLDSQNKSYS